MNDNQEYHPKDRLEIEVESNSNGLVIATHLVNAGKSRLEILASQLPMFQAMIETDVAELARATKKFNQEVEMVRKKFEKEDSKDEPWIEAESLRLVRTKGPGQRFRNENFRDPKPLVSVEVIAKLGRMESAQEIMEKRASEAKAEREAQAAEAKADRALMLSALSSSKKDEESTLKNEVEELKAQIAALIKAAAKK